MRFGTSDAAKGWEELCRQAPHNLRRAWEALRVDADRRTVWIEAATTGHPKATD